MKSLSKKEIFDAMKRSKEDKDRFKDNLDEIELPEESGSDGDLPDIEEDEDNNEKEVDPLVSTLIEDVFKINKKFISINKRIDKLETAIEQLQETLDEVLDTKLHKK